MRPPSRCHKDRWVGDVLKRQAWGRLGMVTHQPSLICKRGHGALPLGAILIGKGHTAISVQGGTCLAW